MKTLTQLKELYSVGNTELCVRKDSTQLLKWCNRMVRTFQCPYFYEYYTYEGNLYYYVAADFSLRSKEIQRLLEVEWEGKMIL